MSGPAIEAANDAPDLTACDREPIHIPGSIQPHGLILIAEAGSLVTVAGAGDIEARLAPDWLKRPLAELLGQDIAAMLSVAELGPGATLPLAPVEGAAESFDASLHGVGSHLIVELEPIERNTPGAARSTLAWLDAVATQLERAPSLAALCERAATAFRELTGFDRVMIYRFLDDDAGTVVAESRAPDLPGFLNHHFPASDIPKQARQLYVRNRIRVIPDIFYEPAPIRPGGSGLATIDLSDVALRSVSPIHIQYLRNMGVGASASVSIVKDGMLWGLVACHHGSPRGIGYDARAAARALAGGLARQIKAKEDAERYRERLRLRAAQDSVTALLGPEQNFAHALDPLRQLLGADGFAVISADTALCCGVSPPEGAVVELGAWLRRSLADVDLFSTGALSLEHPPAAAYREVASGLLAFGLPGDPGLVLAWFRCEHLEQVNWAGNPHKAVQHTPSEQLTPRASFETWAQTVRGRARPWSLEEIDAARRFRRSALDARQNRRLRELNRELGATIADKEELLRQNSYLLKEVNHRVQNSLQLVASFLGLQAKSIPDSAARDHLAEAQNRLAAVAQVHRRLHQDDQISAIDLSRYLEELCADIVRSFGDEDGSTITRDLSPVLVSPDRAVNIGLVLTELVINARKYAYSGKGGAITVQLEQHGNRFALSVADHGIGKSGAGQGFGTRMMNAMVARLDGTISYEDNQPGLRAVLAAPVG